MTDAPNPNVNPASKVPLRNTDGRAIGDWKTRWHEPEAKREIAFEARLLGGYLLVWGFFAAVSFFYSRDLTLPDPTANPSTSPWMLRRHDILVFFVGNLGSALFAIKWLFHSVAHGNWNIDRRLWRVFVPLTGGILALVVVSMSQAGMIGEISVAASDLPRDLILAFLSGYFSDGVSGLLTNVANAIFGKVEQK